MRLTTLLRFACTPFIAAASGSAFPITLGEAVNLALQNDPMPQLNATANTTKNRRDYTDEAAVRTSLLEKYNSNAVQLNLTQPLWQRAKYISLTHPTVTGMNDAKINKR